jgi:type IV secretory pathway VirJ component
MSMPIERECCLQRWMRMSVLFLCLVSAAAFAAPTQLPARSTAQSIAHFGHFTSLHLFKPRGEISGVAILASGDGRWEDPLMNRLAQQLLATGSAVIGIDTVAYLQTQNSGNQCIDMADDFEGLARVMERQLGVRRYLPPVLVGYSSGAALVYAVLAQASRGMFQAGMSLGFCDQLSLQTPLCSEQGLLSKPVKNADGPTLRLFPTQVLPANWVVLQGEQDNICRVSTAQQFTSRANGARLRSLPGVDHFFEEERDWRVAFVNAYRGLQPHMADELPPQVSDLPVTEVPSGKAGDELAILVTGDGGWAELDQGIAQDLAHSGVSVVALSSLQYFWQSRTPQQAARDLSRLMAHYSQVWRRPRVRLLGYSFGADVLPAIINALPAADRARITSVGLLSPLPQTSFEIRVAGWLGQVVGEQPVLPELEHLVASGTRVNCVYGRDDAESLCRTLAAKIAQVVVLPGGHNCNDDHAAIAHAWLSTPVARVASAVVAQAAGARSASDNVLSARRNRLQ